MTENGHAAGDSDDRGRLLGRTVKVMLVLVAMGIMAAAGMYAVLLLTVRGDEVVVPDLSQMTEAEAEAVASKNELKVEVAGKRVEPRVAEGRIFEQDPPAGSTTRPLRTIRVVLSMGGESLQVPSLVGEPIRKAQLTLERIGLRVGHLSYAYSHDLGADQVIAQRPPGGSSRQKGEPIDLLVSRGGPERVYVMPSLTGLAVDRATEALKDVGVRAGISRRESLDGGPAGIVVAQRPPEGFPLHERQMVQLVISQ